jgi:uncharacterized membrane protein HdeD (DUF308 family)
MALFRVRHAVGSRKTNLLKGLLVLLALPSVAGGVSALVSPGQGAHSVLTDIAIFQIVAGVGMFAFALRVTKRARASETGHGDD